MAATCSECSYLKADGDWPDIYGNYWCERKYEKVKANSQECYRFTRAYDRSSSTSRSYYEYSCNHNDTVGGCFITTITTEILGLPDNNVYLNILRKFRNNYLQKNANTIKILEEYDFIGPTISLYLKSDKKRLNVAQTIFNNYLLDIIDNICNNHYDRAIILYVKMTQYLFNYYEINTLGLTIPQEEKNKEYNFNILGHGRLKLIR